MNNRNGKVMLFVYVWNYYTQGIVALFEFILTIFLVGTFSTIQSNIDKLLMRG